MATADWRRAQRKRSRSIAANGAVFGRRENRSRCARERKREKERERERECKAVFAMRERERRETGKFHFVDAAFSTKLQLEK